jgi:hypothetical protein
MVILNVGIVMRRVKRETVIVWRLQKGGSGGRPAGMTVAAVIVRVVVKLLRIDVTDS